MTTNRITAYAPAAASRVRRRKSDQKGIHGIRSLPDSDFDGLWESIVLPPGLKDRLLTQAVLNFTARAKLQRVHLPVHGIILLVGHPGTGKTSPARGLASRTAASLGAEMTFIEVDPHALASAAHGKTQQAVSHLLYTLAPTDSTGVGMETLSGETIAEAMHSIMARIDEARMAADSPRLRVVAS